MSGEKVQRVTLPRDRVVELERRAQRGDDMARAVGYQMEEVAQAAKRDLDQQTQRFQREQRASEQRIAGLSSELQEMERETASRLRKQSQQFQSGIADLNTRIARDAEAGARRMESLQREMHESAAQTNRRVDSLSDRLDEETAALRREAETQRQDYIERIRRQGEAMAQAMETQRRELQSQITDINTRLAQRESNERGLALAWIRDTRSLLDHVDAHHRHAKFKPGVLERLREQLQLCDGNVNQGVHQAAIASAQQVYIKASELRFELTQMELEWDAYQAAAKLQANHVLATCTAQEAARFVIESDEGSTEVEGQIDFWTHGALSALKKEVQDELQAVGSEQITLDALKKSIGRSAERQAECYALAARAKQGLIASQVRQNMADSVAQALAGSGFEVTDSTYEGDDFRGGLHVKLENLQRDEVVTVIVPRTTSDGTVENELQISFFDRSTNDERLRQARVRSLQEGLKDEGLSCSAPVCTPETETGPARDESKLDFERVRQTRPAEPQQKRSR